MKNESLRREMRMLRIPFWRLAQEWGCNETTAIKRFRVELPADEQRVVMDMIHKAAEKLES